MVIVLEKKIDDLIFTTYIRGTMHALSLKVDEDIFADIERSISWLP